MIITHPAMKHLPCLLTLALFILSCSDQDPYELWKAQPNSKIVFSSRINPLTTELYQLDKEGSSTRLTSNNLAEKNPALSPDGQQVVYYSGDELDTTSWELYVLDLTTLEQTRLTDNGVGDCHPDWSPDGNRIVYVSYQDSAGNPSADADLCVINADGLGFHRLTSGPAYDDDPEWSADGSRIVFKSTYGTGVLGRDEIYVIDSSGANRQRITVSTGWQSDHDPSWGQDGQSIVFCRYTGSRPWVEMTDLNVIQHYWRDFIPWNVCRTDLSGKVEVLTDADYAAALPLYSSDGQGILYNQWDFMIQENELIGIEHRMVLMKADGSDPVQMLPYDATTKTIETFDW